MTVLFQYIFSFSSYSFFSLHSFMSILFALCLHVLYNTYFSFVGGFENQRQYRKHQVKRKRWVKSNKKFPTISKEEYFFPCFSFLFYFLLFTLCYVYSYVYCTALSLFKLASLTTIWNESRRCGMRRRENRRIVKNQHQLKISYKNLREWFKSNFRNSDNQPSNFLSSHSCRCRRFHSSLWELNYFSIILCAVICNADNTITHKTQKTAEKIVHENFQLSHFYVPPPPTRINGIFIFTFILWG